MLGQNHETILDFVIRDVRGVLKFFEINVPSDAIITTERGLDVTESIPQQLLADGRIVIGDPPILGLVIEAQSSMDADAWEEKQFKWPHYAIGLRTKLRCPTEVLVITTSRRIERLARKPIQTGLNSWWHALVLGPSNLGPEPSTEFTRNNPTLALLAMMSHGQSYTTPEPAANMLRGLWESELYQRLEKQDKRTYYDRALQALPLWIALALKDDPMTQEYYSPVVLDYVEQGRKEGIEKGIEKGIEAGLRKSILLLLDSRGYSPSDADLLRLENEHDKKVLEAWVSAAANLQPGRAFFDR